MTVFVSLVLGAEAVGFGDSGQIATRVVLVATRTTGALGDGHGQAEFIERRSGPDTAAAMSPTRLPSSSRSRRVMLPSASVCSRSRSRASNMKRAVCPRGSVSAATCRRELMWKTR